MSSVISWLDINATFTRRGATGVAQIDTHGLLAALITQHESGQLHTHVIISRSVRDTSGSWTELDAPALMRPLKAVAERYRTRLARHLRPPAQASSPVIAADCGETTLLTKGLAETVVATVSSDRAVWD